MVRFGSVCSGIEAASVAWEPLGWKAAWFSEIEPFPCAVLAHHYPSVPNHGDMTTLPERIRSGEVEAPDILCGGTPCQAFSVAGLRQSLGDARGNLTLTFCEVADAVDDVRRERGGEPAIIFWENVPGVLNTKDNAFGCFLGGLAGEDIALEPAGQGWSDAGLIVGPRRTIIWRVLNAEYFGLPQRRRRVFLLAANNLAANGCAIEVLLEQQSMCRDTETNRQRATYPCLQTTCNDYSRADGFVCIEHEDAWRRITPTEAERLMGFPDGYTAITWRGKCADKPRYKALGNSWAVPVVRWIGSRIQEATSW